MIPTLLRPMKECGLLQIGLIANVIVLCFSERKFINFGKMPAHNGTIATYIASWALKKENNFSEGV